MIAVVAASFTATGSASAITNGTPDGEQHPEVGVVVARLHGTLHYGCSGTLISPTVFLLAAHCNPAYTGTAVTGLWVDFDFTLGDANLIADSDLHAGTFVANPLFQLSPGQTEGGLDSHDIAVILLDSPVSGIAPASLPPVGVLDRLAAAHGLHGQQFTNVGYGATGYAMGGGPPQLQYPGMRNDSTSTFQALERAYIRESENQALGNGGTCNFDSGGPQFLPGTHEIASITVSGDPYCIAMDLDYRVDTPSARDFLGRYISLP